MQTFLPYPSYALSAQALDRQRLGKQRVEVKQLLLALGFAVGQHTPKTSSWANHPACRMWRSNPESLAFYGATICREWRKRGYQDTLLPQFNELYDSLNSPVVPEYPSWIGRADFHLSHQSNLVRKSPAYYGSQFPGVQPNLEYVWPV